MKNSQHYNELATEYYLMGNYKVAADYWILAADLGDIDAMTNVGCLYFGEEYGMVNNNKAVEWFEKVGDRDVKAMRNLAILYIFGEGVPINMNRAKCLLTKAAKEGYSLAQKNLEEFFPSGTQKTVRRKLLMRLDEAQNNSDNTKVNSVLRAIEYNDPELYRILGFVYDPISRSYIK